MTTTDSLLIARQFRSVEQLCMVAAQKLQYGGYRHCGSLLSVSSEAEGSERDVEVKYLRATLQHYREQTLRLP